MKSNAPMKANQQAEHQATNSGAASQANQTAIPFNAAGAVRPALNWICLICAERAWRSQSINFSSFFFFLVLWGVMGWLASQGLRQKKQTKEKERLVCERMNVVEWKQRRRTIDLLNQLGCLLLRNGAEWMNAAPRSQQLRGKPTRHQQIILHEDWFVIGWGGVNYLLLFFMAASGQASSSISFNQLSINQQKNVDWWSWWRNGRACSATQRKTSPREPNHFISFGAQPKKKWKWNGR